MASDRAPERVFIIDTSSIILPRRLLAQTAGSAKDALYAELGTLVEDGSLLFPPQVHEELNRYHEEDDPEDRAWAWTRKYKDLACQNISPEDLFGAVRRVQEVVDNLVDYEKESPADDADPYVVGLALIVASRGARVTVVTEERNDRAEKTSMQSACALLGLPALTMRVFLHHLGIWPKK